MGKKSYLSFWLILVFFVSVCFSVSAQESFEQKIFSPVAEDSPAEPPSLILYNQYLENGNYYLNQSLHSEAKELFWKAIHLYPERPDAYLNLAIVHLGQKEFKTALRLLNQAESLAKPDYHQAEILFYNLGLVNFFNQEYKQAVVYFEKALAEFSDFAQARYYLGLSFYELGQYENAFVNVSLAVDIFAQRGDKKTSFEMGKFLNKIKDISIVNRDSLINTQPFYLPQKFEPQIVKPTYPDYSASGNKGNLAVGCFKPNLYSFKSKEPDNWPKLKD